MSSLHLLTMLRTAVTSFDDLQNEAFHIWGEGQEEKTNSFLPENEETPIQRCLK